MAYSNFYARTYTALQVSGKALSQVWKFRPARTYLAFILLLQAAAWFIAIAAYRHVSGSLLILHYNINFGADLIGAPEQIFYFSATALVVTIFNVVLVAFWSKRKDFRTLVHMMLSASVLINLLLVMALAAIYTINFR